MITGQKKYLGVLIYKIFTKMADETSPIYGPFFGVMGSAAAMVFSGMLFTFLFSLF